MAKAHKIEKAEQPTTTVQGVKVAVTGTKGGAISMAAAKAKAAKLAGTAPAGAGKYSAAQSIRVLNDEDGKPYANPHRMGTYRAKAWDALVKCKTVGDYVKSGFKIKYLGRWASCDEDLDLPAMIRIG